VFGTLRKKIGADSDYPARVAALTVLRAVLEGTIYDCLEYEFHQEKTDSGEYVKLCDRRPSVRYNLSRLLVEDSISLLFGEGRFPTVSCTDQDAMKTLADIMEEVGLCEVMQDAAFRGSVGSVAILMRVLKGRLFFDVMDTVYLTPAWDPEAPDTLLSVTEQYKVRGDALAAMGYDIDDADMPAQFWFRRIWDGVAESWYLPWKVNPSADDPGPRLDEAKTVEHKLGFVPIVWIKNLSGGNETDGASTFRAAIDTQIEIEYQLSQAGRGLKYSSDPTLLIKEPAGDGSPIIRSAANALVVDEGGDAKLLEINGTASAAVIEYVSTLREMALETIHGNRSSADKVSAASSGRALEMLHQPLIWLADKLRTSYGNRGLLPIVHMIVAARAKVPLKMLGQDMPEIPATLRFALEWPPWFHPTVGDKRSTADRISGLFDDGLLSRETALTNLQADNGIPDVAAEIVKIDADTAAKDARAQALQAQVKATEAIPA
jgi:hypothetical protein